MPEIMTGIVEKAVLAVSSTSNIVAAILGAGSGAAVAALLKKWFPEQTATIADETLATIVGFLMFYFGDRIHPLVSSFGFGILMASAGAWASQFTSGIFQTK